MGIQLKPIIHTFKEINMGKHTWVKHYELKEVTNGKSLLSNSINISKDRKFSNATPDYWLKKRRDNKWSKCITGLFKTEQKNIFIGDIDRKTHLVVFKFSVDKSVVTIYYFKNYYTSKLTNVLPLITN